jgi:hypothetical protein
MKNFSRLLVALAGLVLAAGLVGCATSKENLATQQKENMLQATGFRVISATTPAQQQLLRTLPTDRLSAVRRKGEIYFVYPVPARNVLYVGRNAQYLAYEQRAQQPKEQEAIKWEIQSINRSATSSDWEAPWADWDAQ